MSYVALATTTLGSAASSVTFSSIPATYKDLILVVEASTTASGVSLDIRFNADTGSNYSSVEMMGRNNGTTTNAASDAYFRIFGNTFGTTPFQATMQIMDYSQTNKHKMALVRNSSYDTSLSSYLLKAYTGRWGSTSAVTSVSVESLFNSRSFAAGSTFSLYGLA
jgi:hypothetical protein